MTPRSGSDFNETRTEFYVRVANGTKALDPIQRDKYITSRWGSSAARGGS